MLAKRFSAHLLRQLSRAFLLTHLLMWRVMRGGHATRIQCVAGRASGEASFIGANSRRANSASSRYTMILSKVSYLVGCA